ncbi:hypothetical protein CupriaWKF_07100 [Cupriavidus sp. WKF15]|uniref:hypothetical protein n=1 Tax=Cupriavidus sp. WKF15 TaxID=3032282 RepID=UPI0023E199A7|nr:hypothetical protein [Cupriavidus sp. WKF15]WER47308.1 hypothetical protein CupriaWKF_07100 [Cupriavidus sp. WKF15]
MIVAREVAATVLAGMLSLTVTGCDWHPFGKRSHQAINIAQVPAPVRTTIDRLAGGRTIGEIEKQVVDGKTRYEVTLDSGSAKGTILIGEDGKQLADDDEDED